VSNEIEVAADTAIAFCNKLTKQISPLHAGKHGMLPALLPQQNASIAAKSSCKKFENVIIRST
jgi:hypothetical protein